MQTSKRSAAGEYAFEDISQPPSHDPPPQRIPVRCEVCMTRMDATLDQIGQELICPDCGTAAMVRAPVPPKEKPAAIVAGTDDEYTVCEGVDQPAPTNELVHQSYFPVFCSTCRTRMLATLDQVGSQMVCPDCELPTTVLPPPEPESQPSGPAIPADRHEEYILTPGIDQPAAIPPDQLDVKVVCPHCHSRLHATMDEVGSQIICPDCGTTTFVPEPKQRVPKLASQPQRSEEYVAGAPAERLESPHVKEYLDREVPDRATRPKLPPGLKVFTSGVLGFLLYDGVWQRWVALSAAAILILMLLMCGLLLIAIGNIGFLVVIPVLMAAGLLVLAWFTVTVPICLVIVQESSEGADQIDSWPESVYVDWLFHVLFLFNSLGTATFLGALLRGLLWKSGVPGWPAVPITVVTVFPVLLLSMLETGSMFNPVSWPVWRSLRTAWWAWLVFYFTSGLLVAAGIVLTIGIWLTGPWTTIITLPLVLVGMIFLYARLLGRLGWVCTSVDTETQE